MGGVGVEALCAFHQRLLCVVCVMFPKKHTQWYDTAPGTNEVMSNYTA